MQVAVAEGIVILEELAEDKLLRAAHGEMQPKVVQTTTKLSQSAAVYAAVEHVLSSAGALDESQRRILQSSLQGMKLSGVALVGEQKKAFNANRMALAGVRRGGKERTEIQGNNSYQLASCRKERATATPIDTLRYAARLSYS